MGSSVVLGLDFGGSKTAAAVSDADGQCLGRVITPVEPHATAVQTFAQAVGAARALISRVASEGSLAAVGACTFGIPHDDRVDLAPNIPGWESLPFGSALRQAFPGAAVRMATDVKAAAQAEAESGSLSGCDPGLYVNLGTGFAVAIVVGGRVLTGRHDAAGEIGYSLHRDARPNDPTRLEDVVSGKALDELAREVVGRPSAAELAERADIDSVAAAAWSRFVAELTFHLVNIVITLDPQRVVVGGGMVRSWNRLETPIADALAAAVPFPPELVLATHPFDAPLLGALALGRTALRDRSPVAAALEGATA